MNNVTLSPQQAKIMQNLVDGRTIKETALDLGIAAETVRKHVNKAKVKLGAITHDHAIALVVARGFVIVKFDCQPIE